jgi:hypothetical protein
LIQDSCRIKLSIRRTSPTRTATHAILLEAAEAFDLDALRGSVGGGVGERGERVALGSDDAEGVAGRVFAAVGRDDALADDAFDERDSGHGGCFAARAGEMREGRAAIGWSGRVGRLVEGEPELVGEIGGAGGADPALGVLGDVALLEGVGRCGWACGHELCPAELAVVVVPVLAGRGVGRAAQAGVEQVAFLALASPVVGCWSRHGVSPRALPGSVAASRACAALRLSAGSMRASEDEPSFQAQLPVVSTVSLTRSRQSASRWMPVWAYQRAPERSTASSTGLVQVVPIQTDGSSASLPCMPTDPMGISKPHVSLTRLNQTGTWSFCGNGAAAQAGCGVPKTRSAVS